MTGRITFLFVFFWTAMQGQNAEWIQHFPGNTRQDLAVRGNDILISLPNIGLVHFDTSGNKTHFTTLNSGLPSRFVGALEIAPDGVWWVHFEHSIGSYDGNIWKLWSSSIIGMDVSSTTQIKTSPDGQIYICTESEGIAFYNDVQWQTLTTSNYSLPDNHIVNISFGPDSEKCIVGKNWLIVDDGGSTVVYDSISTGYTTFKNLKSAILLSNNELWVATQFGELFCLKNNSWEKIIRSSIGILSAAYAGEWLRDSEGNLWINFSRSLAKYNGVTWTVYNDDELDCEDFLQDQTPTMSMDGSGKLWIKSCNLWTILNDSWEKISTGNSGLKGGKIREIVETSTGEVWFATNKGILQKKDTSWVYYAPDAYFANEDVSTVTCDSSGNIWFGTNTLEILRYNGTAWTKWDTLSTFIPADYGFSKSVVAPDGSVWFFLYPHYVDGENYAVQFKNNTWSVYSSVNAPFDFAILIRNLEFGENGTYWFHTSTRIVSLKDGIWNFYDESNSLLPGEDMYGMAIDPSGKIWVSSFEGLFYFENQTWQYATNLNNRLPLYSSPRLKEINFDSNGKLYMSMSYRGEPFTSLVAITDSTITSMIPSGFDPKYFGYFINIFLTSVSNRLWLNGIFDNTIFEYNPNPPMFASPPPVVNPRGILAFPNPANNTVNLLFDFDVSCNVQIHIFDGQGQSKGIQTVAFQPGQASSIFIHHLHPGLYTIQATGANHIQHGKIIKN